MKQDDRVAGSTVTVPAIAAASDTTGADKRSTQGGEYAVQQRETLAEVPGLRVRLLTLLEGQVVPWHYHSTITDTFFCMRGPMRIVTRAPDASHRLENGDTLAVAPGTPHYVEAGSEAGCQFMIIQGVGTYDYVPVSD
jgi:quercetin dioxygenase-like cupin family protein